MAHNYIKSSAVVANVICFKFLKNTLSDTRGVCVMTISAYQAGSLIGFL